MVRTGVDGLGTGAANGIEDGVQVEVALGRWWGALLLSLFFGVGMNVFICSGVCIL